MDEKLKRILELCKCSVSISINEHRDIYQTAEEKLKEASDYSCPPELTEDVRSEMIKRDAIVNIQAYPYTPIGFYDVWHWSLDKALDEMLAKLEKDEKDG